MIRRRSLLTVALVVMLVGVLLGTVAGPAGAKVKHRGPHGGAARSGPDVQRGLATVATDPCEPAVTDRVDLSGVAFEYSDDSFQLRTTSCGLATAGGWQVTIHLTSFDPDVTITGVMLDTDEGPLWLGYFFRVGDGPEHPIEGFEYFDNLNLPPLSGRSSFGYGSWADNPTPGAPITGRASIDWYATVSLYPSGQPRDRAPNSGVATSAKTTTPAATVVAVDDPGPNPIRAFDQRADLGTLTKGGSPFPNRYVNLQYAQGGTFAPGQTLGFDDNTDLQELATDADGTWAIAYAPARNTTVRPYYMGDGLSASAVGASYKVLVRAWVTLDLPARKTVDRGAPVRFKGVVRPRQPGTSVLVQIRFGGAGAPWSTFRTVPLRSGPADTFYDVTWRPAVPGTFTFRTVWKQGPNATSDGRNLTGISNYTVVTVR
jgi:hypothetical protein